MSQRVRKIQTSVFEFQAKRDTDGFLKSPHRVETGGREKRELVVYQMS